MPLKSILCVQQGKNIIEIKTGLKRPTALLYGERKIAGFFALTKIFITS